MSSLIEQAARRLAQLRQAGVDIPDGDLHLDHFIGQGTSIEAEPGERASAASQFNLDRSGGQAAVVADGRAGGGIQPKKVELDLNAILAAGMLSPHLPGSLIAEEYRIIKRPLLVNAIGKGSAPPIENGNIIMVTSALPSEGKTFNAINLAMSIAAELDHTVLLVDADVARPSVLQKLGLAPEPGLLDLLLDDSLEVSQVLLKTNVEKLSILPSGTPHPRATELLSSEAMTGLIHQLANRYKDRIVIVDSPPLLVTTESRVLASLMGQIVIVVEAEKTLQSEVNHALATISQCPVKLMILNKAKVEFQRGYSYGYGYAYRYG